MTREIEQQKCSFYNCLQAIFSMISIFFCICLIYLSFCLPFFKLFFFLSSFCFSIKICLFAAFRCFLLFFINIVYALALYYFCIPIFYYFSSFNHHSQLHPIHIPYIFENTSIYLYITITII